MEPAVSSTSDPLPTPATPPRRSRSLGRDLLVVGLLVGLVLGITAATLYFLYIAPITRPRVPRLIKAGIVNPTTLEAPYLDADGDLVADTPTDEAKWKSPDTIVLGVFERPNEGHREEWKELAEALARATGKKVEVVGVSASGVETSALLREGKVHVLALSTGAVPVGVNTAGFVPVCVMARADGTFGYQMEVLVPAGSPVRSTKDLKGRTLGLTSLSSLSSFKAPVYTLWKEHGYLPGHDYEYVIIHSQRASVKGVAEGRFEAVAVANDLMKTTMEQEGIKAEAVRSIYQSPTYPPAAFGHGHDLHPVLAKKVREAFLGFDWKGTGLEKANQAAGYARFQEVRYRDDWKTVREVDAALAEMVGP